MSRESLGTVRLHRWTCDVDETQTENRSKASGPIPLPEGWMHVNMTVERDGKQVKHEADVCSPRCAAAFNKRVLTPDNEDAAAEPAP